jgi:NhaA family Na+:H+ antiporter
MPRSFRAPLRPLREFLRTESASGVLLVGASTIALLWANVAAASYEWVWTHALPVGVNEWVLDFDARHWINEAAMALFFFVVGLEIKRELVDGELRGLRRAALPVLAAAGGMVAPALIYYGLNHDGPGARGWGIPMATDIAFAVGVLALVGARVPVGLKVFLLSVAIVDDIGAIAVIAIFYSSGIAAHWLWLGVLGLLAFAVVWHLPAGSWRVALLVPVAVAVWLFVHASGVHATIAGALLGLFVPATARRPDTETERLEHQLHPWTSFVIVPLFALANAGVQLTGETVTDALASPVALGVLLGLVVGKFVGIGGTVYLATALGVATLPREVTREQILGVAALGGIGFTVSLFITQLAFADPEIVASAKLAIFAASVVAAVAGFALLRAVERGR